MNHVELVYEKISMRKTFVPGTFNCVNTKKMELYIQHRDFEKVDEEISCIRVYDDILGNEELQYIQNECKKKGWEYGQQSIQPDTIENIKESYPINESLWSKGHSFSFFRYDVLNMKYFYSVFYDKILPNIDCILDKSKIVINRMYFNKHTNGACGAFHKDRKNASYHDRKKEPPTVLLYINENWVPSFHGEIKFCFETNEKSICNTISFRHGRIVVFPSYVYHRMCDTSYYPTFHNTERYCIAYHLIYCNYRLHS